jgi:hypothetical protein
MERIVVANPMAELPVQNTKYARECTELYMAKRDFSTLASWGHTNDFEKFTTLEVKVMSSVVPN